MSDKDLSNFLKK